MKDLRSLILVLGFIISSQSLGAVNIDINGERCIYACGRVAQDIMNTGTEFFVDNVIPTAGGIATGQSAFFMIPLMKRYVKPAATTAAFIGVSYLLYRTVTKQVLPAFLPNKKNDHNILSDDFSYQAKAPEAIIASSSYVSFSGKRSLDDLNLKKDSKDGLLRYGFKLKQAVDAGAPLPNLFVTGGDSTDFQTTIVSLAKLGSYHYKVISSEGLLNNPKKAIEILDKLIKKADSGTFNGSKTLLIFTDIAKIIKVVDGKDGFAAKKLRRLFGQAIALKSQNFGIVGHMNNPETELKANHGFYSLNLEYKVDIDLEPIL